jgi:hypothetical protein
VTVDYRSARMSRIGNPSKTGANVFRTEVVIERIPGEFVRDKTQRVHVRTQRLSEDGRRVMDSTPTELAPLKPAI